MHSMKILVPIKRVPDPYERIRLTANGDLDFGGIKWVINPFDEIALEEAVRLRERASQVEIVTVSIGEAICEEQLRASLAMGADRAILIEYSHPTDQGVISHILAAIARRENPDIILMGKQAIDDDCSQIGQRLAAILAIPQATFASVLEISPDGRHAIVTREVDAGRETLEVSLPAVVTTDLRLNEPRYIALPAIIRARSKPLERLSSDSLGISIPTAKLTIIGLETPPPRKAGRRVANVDELLTALRDEARVV